MKKLSLLTFISLICISEAFSMTFVCGDPKSERKYSQISEWYNSVYNRDTKLSGKPGRRDGVIIGNGTTIFDLDTEINALTIGQAAIVKVDKKKIKTKDLVITFPQRASTHDSPILFLKNTSVDLGKFSMGESTQRQSKFGSINFELDNAVLNLESINFAMYNSASNLAPFDNQAGVYFRLKGKSKLNVDSGVYLDNMFKNDARLQFTLVEDSGNVPSVSMKNFEPGCIMLEVKINGKLKKGMYMLIEDTGKKNPKEGFRSIKINGETRNPGDSFDIGENKAKLLLDSMERSGRKNDLILQIQN